MTVAPSAVEALLTSRHLPECTATTFTYPLPRSVSRHCWLAALPQVYWMISAPFAVEPLTTSTHLPEARLTIRTADPPAPFPASGSTASPHAQRRRLAPDALRTVRLAFAPLPVFAYIEYQS